MKNILAKFVIGNTAMSMNIKEFCLFDKDEEYFSMTPFSTEGCVHGKTIIEVNWGNGYKDTKVAESIPDKIDGYEKIL